MDIDALAARLTAEAGKMRAAGQSLDAAEDGAQGDDGAAPAPSNSGMGDTFSPLGYQASYRVGMHISACKSVSICVLCIVA